MRNKHTLSLFKLEQEINDIKMQLKSEKMQKNIDLLKKKEKSFELILLLLIFAVFSFFISSYDINTKKSIQLLQFLNSLVIFAIGLVIGDKKK